LKKQKQKTSNYLIQQQSTVCACGIKYIPESYYTKGKCFLCEETPDEKMKKEYFNRMSDLEKEEYLTQQKEDLANYNLVSLSHY
jgi:hypothetical protein